MSLALPRPSPTPVLALGVLLVLVMALFVALDGHKPPPSLDAHGPVR
jgi:hypothetical protein